MTWNFAKGFWRKIPVDDGWADVATSNGVINLCADSGYFWRRLR